LSRQAIAQPLLLPKQIYAWTGPRRAQVGQHRDEYKDNGPEMQPENQAVPTGSNHGLLKNASRNGLFFGFPWRFCFFAKFIQLSNLVRSRTFQPKADGILHQ
jgi:hypothetical protein